MIPLKVYGTSNFEEKNPGKQSDFFLKMRQFEKKNPLRFENDFKWPNFIATLKR